MTPPAGGEARAEEAREPAPSFPLLVRVAGRWLCRHEVAALGSAERPRPRP